MIDITTPGGALAAALKVEFGGFIGANDETWMKSAASLIVNAGFDWNQYGNISTVVTWSRTKVSDDARRAAED